MSAPDREVTVTVTPGGAFRDVAIGGHSIAAAVRTDKASLYRISIPMPQYMPTEYVLDLEDGKQTGTVDVDQASWDAATVGEQWPPAAPKAGA